MIEKICHLFDILRYNFDEVSFLPILTLNFTIIRRHDREYQKGLNMKRKYKYEIIGESWNFQSAQNRVVGIRRKKIPVKSGIRTHALVGLRPKRSALDHSAILTVLG